MATATLPNAIVVIRRELGSAPRATIRNAAAAVAHMTAGFFVGGAACFDNAIACAGFRSVFV